LFLSSTVKEDNALLAVDLTNPDMFVDGQVMVPRGTLHIARTKFLWEGVCYERLSIRNYGLVPVTTALSLHFEVDFADIFEVRGLQRDRKGRRLEDVVEPESVLLAYEGLDGEVRQTRLVFSPRPAQLSAYEARFDLALQPHGEAVLHLTVSCEPAGKTRRLLAYEAAFDQAGTALKTVRSQACEIQTSNERFNVWLHRNVADLSMMITETATGPYPYAGVPWFSTVFGRDGLITALECLWVNPGMARAVLAYLAATQAQELRAEQDAEPGKILHETRLGEMAALGEIPFGRYYGSVDATPLFVMLAAAYYERTGDQAFMATLWPHIELALSWIDTYGDVDGDEFVEYARRTPQGLVQQGWKDSQDSVFHADGTLAEGPIALCEVQGYVYAAKHGAAALADMLGDTTRAETLRRQAQSLYERFNAAFWCEDLSTYALALDGQKRPCRVRTSNAGHCLLTGIATPVRALRTAQTLLGEEAFSGWGIRTVADGEARYNPMSYHNGSIWPHDNALIAQGLARYGLKDAVLKVLTGLFDASLYVDLHRLPELFCGFVRRPGESPTLYPVACAPQSWAAAVVFQLLQACLGLQIHGPEAQIRFTHPLLPIFLREVHITGLKVGQASVDLLLRRHEQDVGVNVLRRTGDVEVVVVS
jgi:glycogen debranching enzyme